MIACPSLPRLSASLLWRRVRAPHYGFAANRPPTPTVRPCSWPIIRAEHERARSSVRWRSSERATTTWLIQLKDASPAISSRPRNPGYCRLRGGFERSCAAGTAGRKAAGRSCCRAAREASGPVPIPRCAIGPLQQRYLSHNESSRLQSRAFGSNCRTRRPGSERYPPRTGLGQE